jgi:hypothetical protein
MALLLMKNQGENQMSYVIKKKHTSMKLDWSSPTGYSEDERWLSISDTYTTEEEAQKDFDKANLDPENFRVEQIFPCYYGVPTS